MKTLALLLIGFWVGVFSFAFMDTQPERLKNWNARALGLLVGLTLFITFLFLVRGWRAS